MAESRAAAAERGGSCSKTQMQQQRIMWPEMLKEYRTRTVELQQHNSDVQMEVEYSQDWSIVWYVLQRLRTYQVLIDRERKIIWGGGEHMYPPAGKSWGKGWEGGRLRPPL